MVAHQLLHVLEHELLNLVDVLELTDDALEGFSATSTISGDAPSRSTRIAPDSLWNLEERAEGAGRRPGVKPTELISKASMLSAGRRTTRAVRFLARVVSGARVLIPEL